MDVFFEMTVTKIHVIAVTTAMILIATATTMAGFPSVGTVFASLIGTTEQVGNDTTTDATTATAPPAEQQQQQPIHITKDGTTSYVISSGFTSVGSFDTTYRIAGERSAIRSAENLIITTITDDFNSSRTIGYVSAGNITTTTGGDGTAAEGTTLPALPSPFVTPEQVTERITSELRRVITEAESNTPQGQHVQINCDFGMSLEDMQCDYIPSVGAGAAGGSTPTTSTNTTGTTDTTAPISPLEGE
jgi:hypothetical protein